MISRPDIKVAAVTRGELADIVKMIRSLSRDEGDPVELFDSPAAESALFGDRTWLFGQIARAGGAAAGVALWHPAYETPHAAKGGYIVSLWVEPDFRRLGIATRLIAAVAAEVAEIGGSYLWWASKPGNRAAEATYASMRAIQEPVMAHALTGDEFRAMVRDAKEDRSKQ